MTDSAIFLKKGVHIVHVVSAMLVPPAELPEEEADADAEELQERLLVEERQQKMMDKLNLDSLSEWSPHNMATVRELLLSYQDILCIGAP